MVSQKDWVVFDLVRGDLFHVSIVRYSGAKGRKSRRRNSTWYLIGYTAYFGLDLADIGAILKKSYALMLEASGSKEVQEYSYTIAHHDFQKGDMNPNYWRGMLGKRGKELSNVNIQGVHIPVNRKRFEEELSRLLTPYR